MRLDLLRLSLMTLLLSESEDQLLYLIVKLKLSKNTLKFNAEEKSIKPENKLKKSMKNGTFLTNHGSQLTNDHV